METITCRQCGAAVAEDALIAGVCPACDSPLSRKSKNSAPESAEEEGFVEIMDKLDRGEFK